MDVGELIIILFWIGLPLWWMAGSGIEHILRMLNVKSAIMRLSNPSSTSTVTSGESDWNILGLPSTLCSHQGALSSLMGIAGMFLMGYSSWLQAGHVKDAIDADACSSFFSHSEIDALAVLGPILIFVGWMFPKFYGAHHGYEENRLVGSITQAGLTVAGWMCWMVFASIEKTRMHRNFVIIGGFLAAFLELYMVVTSMRNAEDVAWTISRVLITLFYYGTTAFFAVGFVQDPRD